MEKFKKYQEYNTLTLLSEEERSCKLKVSKDKEEENEIKSDKEETLEEISSNFNDIINNGSDPYNELSEEISNHHEKNAISKFIYIIIILIIAFFGGVIVLDSFGIRIFFGCMIGALFFILLFFCGKQLQMNQKSNHKNSLLIKDEPYRLVKEINYNLRKLKIKNKRLDILVHDVKLLEEKLSFESDFGYDNQDVINCENNIAKQIQFLSDTVSKITKDNFDENIENLNMAVREINYLLCKRREMKKR